MANVLKAATVDQEAVEAEIERIVQTTNLPRLEAAAAVARSLGEDVSDLVPSRSLTAEEKDRLGVGRSALDEILQRRQGRPRKAAATQ